MGARVRGVILLSLVLVVGAFAGSALSQWWQAGPRPGALPAIPGTPARLNARVRVEVLNEGGRDRMAQRATDGLRDRGFDVVYYGNGDGFDRDSSVVVARTDRVEWARAVADALGIREVRVERDENRYVDVTVLLGQEWDALPDPDSVPADTLAPWWDLREWFRRRPMAPGPDEHLVDPGETRRDP
jgi:hypothetical protein